MSKRNGIEYMMVLCIIISIGCISQEDASKLHADALVATDSYLYAAAGRVMCLDWEGNTLWETPKLGSNGMIFLGDAIFATTYDKPRRTGGVVFLNCEGEILWQKEIGYIRESGISGSSELLAAGSREGVLWAFSRNGDVLWKYDNFAQIGQVVVAPDSSCVVFVDFNHYVNCVRDGELIWSEQVESIYGGDERNVAFSFDSSYLVHKAGKDEPKIVVSTLNGEEIWSYPVEDVLQSVVITNDNQYIIAGCFEYVYKFTSNGDLVWKKNIGKDNKYIAVTLSANYIAVGSNYAPSKLFVLDKEGEVLWMERSLDSIFAVAISPNGEHVAFSNRLDLLYILSNPPESDLNSA